MFVANVLAKAGYFGGNPQTILETDGGIVLDTFNYEMFCRQYDTVNILINKDNK